MTYFLLIFILVAVGFLLYALYYKNQSKSETIVHYNRPTDQKIESNAPVGTIRKKDCILSPYEKECYKVLKGYLINHTILCQVSFNALVTTRSMQLRAKFNRLYTDFVVVDDDLNVVAIVELDDKSHLKPEVIEKDKARDKILTDAGYKVIRYNKLPDLERIIMDFDIFYGESKKALDAHAEKMAEAHFSNLETTTNTPSNTNTQP